MFFPTLHLSGNFFTARCDYINKLLPIDVFEQRLRSIVSQAMLKRLEWYFDWNMGIGDAPYNYGLGRWSSEHWLASHPSVRACDVSAEKSVKYWHVMRNASEFVFAPFPRRSIEEYIAPKVWIKLQKRKRLRIRDYYLLAGSLFKWYKLYGEAPPTSSWVWDWYPDGTEWKAAILEYGSDAVDKVFERYPIPAQ
jgi:hypothetical protein